MPIGIAQRLEQVLPLYGLLLSHVGIVVQPTKAQSLSKGIASMPFESLRGQSASHAARSQVILAEPHGSSIAIKSAIFNARITWNRIRVRPYIFHEGVDTCCALRNSEINDFRLLPSDLS